MYAKSASSSDSNPKSRASSALECSARALSPAASASPLPVRGRSKRTPDARAELVLERCHRRDDAATLVHRMRIGNALSGSEDLRKPLRYPARDAACPRSTRLQNARSHVAKWGHNIRPYPSIVSKVGCSRFDNASTARDFTNRISTPLSNEIAKFR